jgi:hypothetical protein
MPANVLGKNRPSVALLLERIELAAAHLYDGEFRCHEKGIQDHHAEDDRQFGHDDQGRIPVLNDGIGQRRGREKN